MERLATALRFRDTSLVCARDKYFLLLVWEILGSL